MGLQTRTGKMGRQRIRGIRQKHGLFHRAGWAADAVALRLPTVRAFRHLGFRNLSKARRACRRHGLYSLLFHGDQQPFAGALPNEHRDESHGFPLSRLVDHLRPRIRKRKLAGIHSHVRHPGTRSAEGPRPELGCRIPARSFSGNRSQRPGIADRQSRARSEDE
jgi:hypothetical protein